jgi:hypothetical protein
VNNSACEVLTRCALQNLLGPEQTASASHSLKAASTTVLNDSNKVFKAGTQKGNGPSVCSAVLVSHVSAKFQSQKCFLRKFKASS